MERTQIDTVFGWQLMQGDCILLDGKETVITTFKDADNEDGYLLVMDEDGEDHELDLDTEYPLMGY